MSASESLRCAVCGYKPDALGSPFRKADLREHIETHSVANLWELAYEKSGVTEGSE